MDQTLMESASDSDEHQRAPKCRAPGGLIGTVFLGVLTIPFLGWTALPLVGLDTHRYTSALVALTQYAVPAGAGLTLLALVLRRWWTASLIGLITVALMFSVAPRAIPDALGSEHAASSGATPLRVLSVNLHMGEAEVRHVVDLVRRNQVDVLSLQELTPRLSAALDRAGLPELLPHRVFQAGPGGEGTGIASRYPLRELSLVPPATLNQPSARIDLPGARDVEFVAVHPMFPVGANTIGTWRSEIGALPGHDGSTPRVLAGDFNATLDHTPLRGLLGRGYDDVAEVTGDGLRPSWPGPGVFLPPPVTIDHVLVGGEVTADDFRTFDVGGTDHRAILADLRVPG